MSEQQVVIFRIDSQLFGAEASQVYKIIRFKEIEKVPKMPGFIEGVHVIGDSALPVINLVKRFNMGDFLVTKKTKILVARIDDKYAGFIVDDIAEIVGFSEDEFDLAPVIANTQAAPYLKKVGKKGDTLISIIDLEKVLSDSEIKTLIQ